MTYSIRQVTRLTPEESKVFWETLTNPPEPSEAVKTAVRWGVEMSRQLAKDGVVRVTLERAADLG
jgi:hypothetical protein